MRFFFFKRYPHHQDLHSFPTRRSSDLSPTSVPPSRWQFARWHGATRGSESRPSALALHGREKARRPAASDRVTASRDRKSTRLNSSHVSISYAVFCLKKKKKNKI